MKSTAKCLADCIVGPSDEERCQQSTPWSSGSSTLDDAVKTFLSSGCCVVPGALPLDFVQTCLAKARNDLSLLEARLDQHRLAARSSHEVASAWRVDYREMVDRDGGRRDVRIDWDKYPFNAPGLIYNGMILPLIQALLQLNDPPSSSDNNNNNSDGISMGSKTTVCQDITLLYTGVMWAKRQQQNRNDKESNPGQDTQQGHQKWHADGGHLFGQVQLPPHCINVFIPLINLTSEHGPTEVQVGSHRLDRDKNGHPLNLELTAQAGDAILFDYRLQHRGKLCSSVLDQDRPILYLAYAKSWFRDTANTRSGRSIFQGPRPVWNSRILTGTPLPLGQGFERVELPTPPESKQQTDLNASSNESSHDTTTHQSPADGSGERWVLFKMNVQIGGTDNDNNDNNKTSSENLPREETLVVYNGDLAVEVATQFCYQHQLGPDFIPVLAETIQQQMNEIMKQQQQRMGQTESEPEEPQRKRPKSSK